MITCDNCGRENEEEFKFCLGCGSPLSRPKKEEKPVVPDKTECPHCSALVPAGFKFCGACGGSLVGLEVASSPAATVQAGGPVHREPEDQVRRLGELTVIQPDGSEGARIPLTSKGVVLGRTSEFKVLEGDPFLSPRHAEVVFEDGIIKLRDLGSVNGVYWRLRDDVELEDGDMIRVGQELLRFQKSSTLKPLVKVGEEEETSLQGSPAGEVWGRLALIGGPDQETRAFALKGHEATIGREVGSIVFGDDGFVSGKHARIYRDQGRVYLRDLGSSNGSYLRIRGERRLSNGDLVLMGQQLFRISIG